jgi:hypothetical protein
MNRCKQTLSWSNFHVGVLSGFLTLDYGIWMNGYVLIIELFYHPQFLLGCMFIWRLKTIEGPIRRTRERGSEWEPIKILLEGDGNSNKTNTASNTRLRFTTQVGQIHVATGVLLNLGTNFQPYRPEDAAEHQTSSPLTGQTGEHHQSDRSLLVKLGDFHRKAPHWSDRRNTPVRPVSARKPQNTKQAYRASN